MLALVVEACFNNSIDTPQMEQQQMGTRSLTRIFDGDKEIACIYRQCDGYPSCHGVALSKFILSGKFVNGISFRDTGRIFNGMGCFAAQLVGYLKGDKAGGIYLYAPGTSDVWEEYVYEVRGGLVDGGPVPVNVRVVGYGDQVFDGTPVEFDEFCRREESDE